HALAQALAIEGTPAFIIGDQIIPGADMNALTLAIANARASKLKAG
ncbi:disulfide bond formation protein DsbA, partial [Pseudomonas sp. HMWF010]